MVMIFADVWKTAPFMALLVLAGLQTIPGEIYEAAKVDGATAWQRFVRITLPLLKPAILVALIFRTLDALRIFDLPYVLTKGAHDTNTLSLISYQEFGTEPAVRRGLCAGDPDVRDRHGGLVPVHPIRRRQPTRPGGGLRHGSCICSRDDGRPHEDGKKRLEGKTPWWMWVAVFAIVVFCLFPFYWLLNTSLKTGPDLSTSALVPPNPTLDNYESIFKDSNFTDALRNSAIVALVTTALALIVGSFCAYALARLRIRFKFWILAIILTITTFPQITIAAPIFKLWRDVGLYNTIPGLVIPYLTFALPLAIYILTSFFREIPQDLEEAALVDGATNFQAFCKVVVPLAAPGLATAGILTFIAAWNEFLLAITLTSSPAARTVPAAIAFFTGSVQFEQPLGTISAASVTISIPLIIMVLLFQKRIVAGLTAGAVKG